MEKLLFDWEGWDQNDTFIFQFYDCTLKVPIGPFAAGDKFDLVNMDFENGKLEIYEDEKIVFTGKLLLSVEAL